MFPCMNKSFATKLLTPRKCVMAGEEPIRYYREGRQFILKSCCMNGTSGTCIAHKFLSRPAKLNITMEVYGL